MPTATQGSSDQPFGFTGEQRDAETGFVSLRARMYDPQIGRFLSRDPVRGLDTEPGTLNPYVYALNNPLNLTDPSGELPILVAGAAALRAIVVAAPVLAPRASGVFNQLQGAVESGRWQFAQGWNIQLQRAAEYARSGALRQLEERVGGRIDLVVGEIGQLINVEVKYWTQTTLTNRVDRLAQQVGSYLENSGNRLRLEFVRTKTDPIIQTADDILAALERRGIDTSRLEILFPDVTP